ncbi:MAG: class I SAM-dependent methyltransferase [Bdellovibrionales bacterium]|nr:class I SAM-dependent methyltransferase [Bdellovibrionales bacterium]
MGWLKSLADNTRERSLAVQLRRKRIAWFHAAIEALPRPLRILDLGGTELFWQQMGLTNDNAYHITILNLDAPAVTATNVTAVAGDARNVGAFANNSFDVVFSNSVIEHVGNDADQLRMANEVRRLAPCYFIQTPNRYFPIEPHFLMPLFQFYPRWLQVFLIRRFDLGFTRREPDAEAARRTAESVRLLDKADMARLFPDAQLLEERLFGLTKSLVAVRAGSELH